MEEQQQLPGIAKEKRKRKSRQYFVMQFDGAGQPKNFGGPHPSEAACIATAPTDGDYLILVKSSQVSICTIAKKEVKKRG